MADLAASIAQARKAGYSDAEIAAYIGKDPTLGAKVKAARQAGYSDAEVVAHLGASPARQAGRQSGKGAYYGGAATFDAAIPFMDEAKAGIEAGVDTLQGKGKFSENWKARRDWQAGAQEAYQKEHPVGANLFKGLAYDVQAIPAFLTGGASAAAPNLFQAAAKTGLKGAAATVGRNAAVGGAYAAGNAFADRGTLGERFTDAGQAIPAGAVVGAVVPAALSAPGAAARAASGVRAKIPARAPKVDLEKLAAEKTAAYRAAENAGVTYSPQAFGDLVQGLSDEATAASINPMRHPKASSMLQDFQKMREAGYTPTLTQIDQLRQVVRRDVASAKDPSEAFFGQRMIRSIDEFVDAAGPGQVTGGDATRGAEALKRARDLNTRLRKAEAITEATDRGELRAASTGAGGNTENAVRQNLRRVLETTHNLTPEERAVIEEAVRGGPLQNALRLIGKMAPTNGALSMFTNLGAAGATGGSSLGLSAAGQAAKMGSEAMTRGNVDRALSTVVNGPMPPPVDRVNLRPWVEPQPAQNFFAIPAGQENRR
jgi:hypothetical protein